MNTRTPTAASTDLICAFCTGPMHPKSLQYDHLCGGCWNSGIRMQSTQETQRVEKSSFFVMMVGTHQAGTIGHDHPRRLLEAYNADPPTDQTLLVDKETLHSVFDRVQFLLAEHWCSAAAIA